ncbi:Gustatory receptor 3, partial [Halyomorpha halys]
AWVDGPLWTSGLTQKRNSYFKQIKLILLLLRLLGRFPYGISDEGIKPFSITSFPALYTILFYVACGCFSIKTMFSLLGMLKESQNYDHSLQILMLMSYLIQNFVIPITYWQKSDRIVEYIALWSRFESEYSQEFNQLSCQKWIVYCSIFFAPIGVLYCFRMYLMIGVGMTNCLMFMIVIYASDLLSLLWLTTLYEIRQQARKLCHIVSCEGIGKETERKRYCWLTISSLASSLSDAIGLAIGGLTMSLFFSFLISCYGRLTSFMYRVSRAELVWWEMMESCIIYVYFFFMFDCAEKTSILIADKFSSIVLNLKHPKMDKETLEDMTLFLSCISACPPTINFAGFRVVDRTLLTSLVSNSVTYLVMLFQYRRE